MSLSGSRQRYNSQQFIIMDSDRIEKFYKLMDKLLTPNFDFTDIQLEIICKNLREICSGKIEEEFFSNWFRRVIQTYISCHQLTLNVLSFICSLIGLVCEEEQIFLNLNFAGLLEEFLKIIISYPEFDKLQIQFINIVSSFLKHKSGLNWTTATRFWHTIFNMVLLKTDENVFKEGIRYLVELIYESEKENNVFYKNLLKILLSPLLNVKKIANYPEIVIEEEEIYIDSIKRLSLLDDVLEAMMIKCCLEKNFVFIDMLQKQFGLEQILEDLSKIVRISELDLKIRKLLTLVIYFTAAKELITGNIDIADRKAKINFYSQKICNVLFTKIEITKCYSDILDLIHFNHNYLKIVVKNCPWASVLTQEFEYQMSAFLFIPVNMTFVNHGINVINPKDEDEIRECFHTFLYKKILPVVCQIPGKFKKSYSTEDAINCLRHVQNYATSYQTCTVINIVRALVYILKDILIYFRSNKDISFKAQDLILATMETLIYLFTEFDISWSDSVEITYVPEIVTDILEITSLPSKTVTRTLQLANVTIRKNLLPEAILLIDIDDEQIDRYSRVYGRFLFHSDSEIRTAIIQCMQALVQTKLDYPSVKHLLNSRAGLSLNYTEQTLKISTTDPETTVRVTALRCFQDMVESKMCDDLLKNDNVYEEILLMFKSESEGCLRSEYINLISSIYENYHDVADSIVEKFYNTMTFAVLDDDYLPIKINALAFWQIVINRFLSDEGMIDGEFPSVTFSKKLKKIISFDETKIKNCLHRVLCKLSANGCLRAFMYALNSRLNSYLIDTARRIIKSFIQLLKKYYITPPSTADQQTNVYTDPVMTITDDLFYSSSPSNEFSIKVVCEDLNSQNTFDFSELLIDYNYNDTIHSHINEFLLYVESCDYPISEGPDLICENNIDVLLDTILV